MDNLKDFKNEALVVTNASDGNTPHIVQSRKRTDSFFPITPLTSGSRHRSRASQATPRNRPPVGEWTRWIGSSSHAWA